MTTTTLSGERHGRPESRRAGGGEGGRLALFFRHTVALSLVLVASCGSSLPRPPYIAHTSADLVAIPYPPPPARIEIVPDSTDDRAVWIDGEWSWTGKRWSWRRGRWVIPPQGAAFAPWQAIRDRKGNLFLASGGWRSAKDPKLVVEEPASVGEAKGGRIPILNLDGEEEPTGADIRSERPERDAGANRTPRASSTSDGGAP